MSENEREIPPGEGVGIDLSIADGEEILILRRGADGAYSIPAYLTNKSRVADAEMRAAILVFCHGAVDWLRGGAN